MANPKDIEILMQHINSVFDVDNPGEVNKKFSSSDEKKFYKMLINFGETHDLSPLSQKLHSITGCYANEYIPPVTELGPVFHILVDESEFKTHACVGAVMMTPDQYKDNATEAKLDALCSQYGFQSIHFTEIFSDAVSSATRTKFLSEYADIVRPLTLFATSFSCNKLSFLQALPFEVTDSRELYFNLFGSIFEAIAEQLPEKCIYHVAFEKENNLSIGLCREYVSKLYSGLIHWRSLEDRKASVCRHPVFFSKKALLCSSSADLVAFASNRFQQKLDTGIAPKKLISRNRELVEVTREVFPHFMSLSRPGQQSVALLLQGKLE